jgi:hypothetical protein
MPKKSVCEFLEPISEDILNRYALSRLDKAKKSILGKKFNRLEPLEVYAVRDQSMVVFMAKCKCDCGNIKNTRIVSLKQSNAQSCGCFNADKQRLEGSTAAANALYSSRRADARRRFLEFSLTKKEYKKIISQPCYYCNSDPANEYGSNMYNENVTYQGIDRIDNSRGYTVDNCRPCCKFCNMSKSTQTETEFLERIERIYNHTIKDSK